MTCSTSLNFSDGINLQKFHYKRHLNEIDVVCVDTRNLSEMPSNLSESILKVLDLPLCCNNYELATISFIVSAMNRETGNLYGAFIDPYITFPWSAESILVDNYLFHPVTTENSNLINFICFLRNLCNSPPKQAIKI